MAIPNRLYCPFASGGMRATIPALSAGAGRATWVSGFPEETALPVSAGGIPPHYMDFQGVLHDITEHVCYQQDGGLYPWVASAANQYAKGAIVTSGGYTFCAVSDPNGGAPVASGTGANRHPVAQNNWAPLCLADGTTIVVGNGGLASVNAAGIAGGLAGSGMSAAGGKLNVGAGNGVAVAANSISVKAGRGLYFDNNGNLCASEVAQVTPAGLADQATIKVNAQSKLYVVSAPVAGRATNDGNGRNIVNTYLPISGGTVTGNLTLNKDLKVANAATVKNLTVQNNAALASGTVTLTPAVGDSSTKIANTKWVTAKVNNAIAGVNTKITSSGGIYRRAKVTCVCGTFNGSSFKANGSRVERTDGTFYWGGSYQEASLREGRYYVSNCVVGKPVLVLHDARRNGDCWLRIRRSLITSGSGGLGTGAGCVGGFCAAGNWFRIGKGDGAEMESFTVIPTAKTVVIDVWDDPRGYGGGYSDDDRLYFYN